MNEQQERDEYIQQLMEFYRDFGITEILIGAHGLVGGIRPGVVGTRDSAPHASEEQLEHLRQIEIGDCTLCKLHKGRKTIVFGEGNPHPQLMLVGEAPGADEDVQGRPFVGRAGQLLMQMIKAINFERKDVYIANVLKCRPPNNRPPEPDEISFCSPFLWKQISVLKPKVILALGVHSAQTLLKSRSSIGMLRNRVYEMPFAKVVATYHPSYLLRAPEKKREAWEDLKLVAKTLSEN